MIALSIFLFIIIFGVVFAILTFPKISKNYKKKDIRYLIQEIKNQYSQRFNDGVGSEKILINQLDYFREYPLLYNFISKIALILMQAGSKLTLSTFLIYTITCFMVGLVILVLITKKITFIIFVLGCLIGLIPYMHIRNQANKRRILLEEQLPQALDFLSRGLRAGHALTISISMAGKELPDPIGYELRKTYDEINFGIPFNLATENLALRVNSQDYNFLVISLAIQRETGGNLTELLNNLSKTIRDRLKLAGKVRTLSAESKFSAVMLCIFPFLIGFILFLISPNYISVLWTTDRGLNMIATGLLFMILGGLWMSRIVKIKV